MFLTFFVFVLIIFLLLFLVSLRVQVNENFDSPYECGFDPKMATRVSFSLRFFLVGILFLIFDVEVCLMLSIPFLFFSWSSSIYFSFFVFLLFVGLVYEIWNSALDWIFLESLWRPNVNGSPVGRAPF